MYVDTMNVYMRNKITLKSVCEIALQAHYKMNISAFISMYLNMDLIHSSDHTFSLKPPIFPVSKSIRTDKFEIAEEQHHAATHCHKCFVLFSNCPHVGSLKQSKNIQSGLLKILNSPIDAMKRQKPVHCRVNLKPGYIGRVSGINTTMIILHCLIMKCLPFLKTQIAGFKQIIKHV